MTARTAAPADPPPTAARRPHRPGGGVPCPGGGDCGGGGHEGGGRSPGNVSRQRHPGVSHEGRASVVTSTKSPPDGRAAAAGGDARFAPGPARGGLPGRAGPDRSGPRARRGMRPGLRVGPLPRRGPRGGRGSTTPPRPPPRPSARSAPRAPGGADERPGPRLRDRQLRRRLLVAPHRALHRARAATWPRSPGCSRTTASAAC